jgi:hypothetical protein
VGFGSVPKREVFGTQQLLKYINNKSQCIDFYSLFDIISAIMKDVEPGQKQPLASSQEQQPTVSQANPDKPRDPNRDINYYDAMGMGSGFGPGLGVKVPLWEAAKPLKDIALKTGRAIKEEIVNLMPSRPKK